MRIDRAIITAFAASLLFAGCANDGMEVTDSGYMYRSCVDVEGEPGAPGDMAFVHVKVMAGDSILFDTRAQGNPTPLRLPQEDEPRDNLAAVRDVLEIMSIGDSLQLTIPVDSLDFRQPGIDSLGNIVYDIKVTDIMTPEQYEEWRANEMKKNEEREAEIAEFVDEVWNGYRTGALDSELRSTESGLKYIIHEPGTGDRPSPGQIVTANYYGVVAEDGSMFDNSFRRGQGFQFQLGMGQVIRGWDEGFGQLKEGARATFFIPSELGYGEQGSPPVIPPNAELVFYVELTNIN